MPFSDVLQSFRKSGYGPDKSEKKDESGGPRLIKLTDEEVKDLQSYQNGSGEEQTCEVTGRLGSNGEFSVISVRNPGGGSGMGNEDEMAAAVMGKSPVMQNQTMPSPS